MYFNNTEKCAACKFPIVNDWLCDPNSSDREHPDYYHLGCWDEMSKLVKEIRNGKQQVQPKG